MNLLLHVVARPLEFLLKSLDESARAVLEENDEAKGEKDKEQKPKETAYKAHGAEVN